MKFRRTLIASVAVVLSACGTTSSPRHSSISAVEASQWVTNDTNAVILDVRTREEFADGHLPGAKLIPWTDDDFESRVEKELKRDKPLLVYCARGPRSNAASEKLAALGFQVRNLDGGIHAWKRGGHPITPPR
jgi:rhodanese-related sulfurtransferase